MGISSAGIGSGLDVNGLISQLMQVERQPLDALNTQKQSFNDQLSAFGRVKSDLDSFRSAASDLTLDMDFSGTTATSSNTSILNATTSDGSTPGTYAITVSTLAQAGVKASLGQTDSSAAIGSSNISSDPATISFSAAGKSFNISVTATDSLNSIRDKINSAIATDNTTNTPDTSAQTVASASIVNAGTAANPNYQLVVAATGTGLDNDVSINTTDANLKKYLGFSSTQTATNASFSVNGLNVERSTNSVSDVIAGVTLNLASANSATPVTLTVGRDKAAITQKVNAFISAYNKVADTVSSLHQKGGTLEADNSVTSVIYQLQGVFNQPANIAGNSYSWLAQIGISFDKNGHLNLDNTTFSSALDNNFNNVVSLFTDTNSGLANRLYSTASSMLDANGLVDSRITGINSRIGALNDSIDQENVRLSNTEQRLRTQYSNLDALLGTMKNTSSYLASQLR
jgi:flagellar hook-associated protein 2